MLATTVHNSYCNVSNTRITVRCTRSNGCFPIRNTCCLPISVVRAVAIAQHDLLAWLVFGEVVHQVNALCRRKQHLFGLGRRKYQEISGNIRKYQELS